MKKIRFHLLVYFIKLAQLIFRIGIYINVFLCNGHVAIYFRQFYADKGVKGPKIYPQIWRCLVILTELKHIFLHPTTNTCYNSVRPDTFITQDVALIKK